MDEDGLLPGRGESLALLVVAGEAVDAGLDVDELELGGVVLAVALKMLADVDGLLDEVVEVLGNLRGET